MATESEEVSDGFDDSDESEGDASDGDGYNDTEIGHYDDADDNVGAFPQQEDDVQYTTTNVLTLAGDTILDPLREAETTKDVQSGSTYTLDTAQLGSIDTNAASDSISTVGLRLRTLHQSRKQTRADFDIEEGGPHRCEDCDLEVNNPVELLVCSCPGCDLKVRNMIIIYSAHLELKSYSVSFIMLRSIGKSFE